MSVSEYEAALRYAGSLPDGTDVEYTPRPYIVHPPLGDVVAAQGAKLAEHDLALVRVRERLAHVERLLHRAINGCTDDYGEEVVSVPKTGMGLRNEV